MPAPAVDGDRLWASIQAMARVGATPTGGVRRLALTPEDLAGRELLLEWLEPLGCEVRRDAAGNLFARRPGADPGAAAVAVGSHLDSQPDGGAFDGALGVLAGLEVLRALDDAGHTTRRPIELVVWTDEEGARFDVSCVGSQVWAGALPLDDARELRDGDGATFGDALAALGDPTGAVAPDDLDAYFELHIEQGPQLEEEGVAVGVVEGIFAIRWLEVTLTGRQSHAGTTPMDRRADAALAAARVIDLVDAIGRGHGPDGRGTVCTLALEPDAGSVIAGGARLMVDLRHSSEDELDAMQDRLQAGLAELPRSCGVRATTRDLWIQPRIRFDPSCVDLVQTGADAAGLTSRRMLSGAGHDAGYVAGVVPTAMIFVPCRGGVSHHPDEWASPEAVREGAQVLLDAVRLRADRS